MPAVVPARHAAAQPAASTPSTPSQARVTFDPSTARFQHIETVDGLPENSAYGLLQDHLGFIWIGTFNGLVRYDGIEMKVFQPVKDDPFSIGGSAPMVLIEDRAGDLWIGTAFNGLVHYDRSLDQFTTYRNDPDNPESISSNNVMLVHEDAAGNIWVRTGEQHIDRLNRESGMFTRYRHDAADPGSLSHDLVPGNLNLPGLPRAAFFEDTSGTIWIGTMNGLNRFDPETESFSHFLMDSDTSGEQTGSHQIVHIDGNADGYLWLSTRGRGLIRFEIEPGEVTSYLHDPTNQQSIAVDSVHTSLLDLRGDRWVSTTRGLDRLNTRTGTFEHFGPADGVRGGATLPTLKLVLAEAGGVWFMSALGGRGVEYYDYASDSFTVFSWDPNESGSLSRWPTSILRDKSGTLWIGAGNTGINKLLPDNDFHLHTNNPYDPASLVDNAADDIYEAPSEPGILWIGTRRGLDRLDLESGTYSHFRHDPADPLSLSSDIVQSLFEDSSGRFWVATQDGLDLMDRRTGTFTHMSRDLRDANSLTSSDVTTLFESHDGLLWIGTGFGLNAWDRQTNTFTHYTPAADTTHTPYSRQLSSVIDSLYKRNGSAAAISRPGNNVDRTIAFQVTDPGNYVVEATGEFRVDIKKPEDYGWIEDAAGTRIWQMSWEVSRHAGGAPVNRTEVAVLRLEPGAYTLHFSSNQKHAFDDWDFVVPDKPESWGIRLIPVSGPESVRVETLLARPAEPRLTAPIILAMEEDANGDLWIGTNAGLNKLDRATDSFRTWPGWEQGVGSVTSLFRDSKNRLWMGDYSHGVGLIDPDEGPVKQFQVKDGLPSNVVMSVEEAEDGALWLGTFNGISRFDPETEMFRNFDIAFGLQDNEFFQGSERTRDGTMFFGGWGGFNSFRPEEVVVDSRPPPVVLTDFTVSDQSIRPGPDSPLAENISVASSVELAHDQNDFSVHFAALHFARPERNRLEYLLEPLEDVWNDGSVTRRADYMNLDPGDYTFRVRAANPDGVWNPEDRLLHIRILPPWWQTTAAYLLYGILLIGALVAGARAQKRRVVRNERERARERELEQAREIETAYTKLKSTQAQLIESKKLASLGALTAGIAHEIKNPLNFVNNFAEVSEEMADELAEAIAKGDTEETQSILAEIKNNASQIAKHGRRADSIVKSMMQHARGGASDMETIEVNTYLEEYINLAWHGMRARDENFQAEVIRDFDAGVGSIRAMPQELGRVILNLLNNAFDAVRQTENARVTVSTARTDSDAVTITVSDNGPGIPPEIREKIFEPFFTTKATGEGTGLGLSLSHDIITKGHGGTLAVRDAPDGGAQFEIILKTGYVS